MSEATQVRRTPGARASNAPIPAGAQLPPAPPPVPPAPATDLPDLPDMPEAPSTSSLQDALAEVVRAWQDHCRDIAGYHSLYRAYMTHTQQLPAGERQCGLPIFTWKATSDGRDSREVCVDLRKLKPEHVYHVLMPLLVVLYETMQESKSYWLLAVANYDQVCSAMTVPAK